MIRFLYTIVLYLFLLVGSWWIFLTLSLLGLILWPRYYEGLVAVFLFDSLFSLPGGILGQSQYALSTFFLVAFVLLETYKNTFFSAPPVFRRFRHFWPQDSTL